MLSYRMILPRVRHRLGKLIRWPSQKWENHIRPRVLSRNVEHISGPECVDYGLDEVVVICVVRNGASHIRSFIEHHFGLGWVVAPDRDGLMNLTGKAERIEPNRYPPGFSRLNSLVPVGRQLYGFRHESVIHGKKSHRLVSSRISAYENFDLFRPRNHWNGCILSLHHLRKPRR